MPTRSARRRRRWAFTEVVVSTSLAVTMIAVGTTEIARQHAELRVASESARVRAVLMATYERLRVGLLSVPPTGEAHELPTTDAAVSGLRLELVGLESPAPGARAVEVRASWSSGLDGSPRQRALTTLVLDGGDA